MTATYTPWIYDDPTLNYDQIVGPAGELRTYDWLIIPSTTEFRTSHHHDVYIELGLALTVGGMNKDRLYAGRYGHPISSAENPERAYLKRPAK